MVEMDLTGISSPSEDGTCQHFNPKTLEMAIDEFTDHRTLVTDIEGGDDALCEVSACSPSPCRNGGSCTLNENVVGGYECACRQGYRGTNCTLDENECNESKSVISL